MQQRSFPRTQSELSNKSYPWDSPLIWIRLHTRKQNSQLTWVDHHHAPTVCPSDHVSLVTAVVSRFCGISPNRMRTSIHHFVGPHDYKTNIKSNRELKLMSTTMMNTARNKLLMLCMLCIFLSFAAGAAASFVIPSSVIQPTIVHVQTTETALPTLALRSSIGSGNTGPKKNFLAEAASKIASLFKGNKNREDDKVEMYGQESTRHFTKEIERSNRLIAPIVAPWPIRALTHNIENKVHRELAKEERKARPLLQAASKRIQADDDLMKILGSPIQFGRVFSHQERHTTLNNKKATRIIDSFEVIGSKKRGQVSMVADKYSKAGIQALRVNVDGIHYDI